MNRQESMYVWLIQFALQNQERITLDKTTNTILGHYGERQNSRTDDAYVSLLYVAWHFE